MGTVDLFGVSVPSQVAIVMIGEIVIAALFVTAVLMAAFHKGWYHHYLVLSGFLLDELVMKPLMYSRLSLGVFGSFPYKGTSAMPHLVLAAAATVLGIAAIYLGFRYRTKKDHKMFMPPKGKIHRYIGALYLLAWLATLIGGLRIFGTFYLQ
jgi:hypothetical protein